MKKLINKYQVTVPFSFIFFIFIQVTVPSLVNAVETSIKYTPQVNKVIFYPTRAMVIRKGTVTLKKGRNLLVFSEAPVALDQNSLRAFSKGKGIMVQSIHTFKEKKMVSSVKEIRDLEKELKRLSYDRFHLESERKRFYYATRILESFERYLKEYIRYSSQRKNAGSEEWKKASKMLTQNRILYDNEHEKMVEGLKINNEERILIQNKLNEIRSRYDKTIRNIEIRLISDSNTTSEIVLSYITTDAGWKAAYAFHLSEKPASMKMVYYGDLYQKTGENWKNINVELSTTRPALGAKRPDVYALGIYGKEVKKDKTDYYSQEKESTEGAGGKSSSQKEDKDEYRFSIPHKISIQSRDQTYRLKVYSSPIRKYDLHYRLFPSVSRFAHIMASFQNESDIPFLSGNADLYRNGSYAGRSILAYTPSNSPISMGFGMDRNIKITRKHKKYSEETGVFTSGRKYKIFYDTVIESQSRSIKNIFFYERLPVSETDSVIVKISDKTTKNYENLKEHPGILIWKIPTRRGQATKIHFEYSIEGPENFYWNIDP